MKLKTWVHFKLSPVGEDPNRGAEPWGGVSTAHYQPGHATIIYTPLATNSFSNTYMVYTAFVAPKSRMNLKCTQKHLN